MKYIILLLLASCMQFAFAQNKAKEEIYHNPYKAGGNLYAYPTPQQAQTPAPKGYKPFYIGHYARHGSRFLGENDDYELVIPLLEKADSVNNLTPKGKETLNKLYTAYSAAKDNHGKLTKLGARQHHEMANRMNARFPEVFGKNSKVDAYSTRVDRSQKSMEAFCDELKMLHPKLNINQTSDPKYYYFMACKSDSIAKSKTHKEVEEKVQKIDDKYHHSLVVSSMLFVDTTFVSKQNQRHYRIGRAFHHIAESMQNVPEQNLSFLDLFDEEQLYNYWKHINLDWAKSRGAIEGLTPKYKAMRGWLREMLTRADIACKGNQTGATVCFGHDSYLYPLAIFLGLDGCHVYKGNDYENVDKELRIHHIAPMGCNVQMIFYRKKKSDDILVKFLLQEEEQHIDVPTDMWPYYHLADVIAHFKEDL